MNEIYFVYRKSNRQGTIGICLDFYAKQFETINKAQTNAAVLVAFAQFKIAYWNAADRVYQENFREFSLFFLQLIRYFYFDLLLSFLFIIKYNEVFLIYFFHF